MSFKSVQGPVPRYWVLDANVLFSDWMRWLMVCLADSAGATPVWTELIEEECFRNLVRLGRLHPEDAAKQRDLLSKLMKAQIEPPPSPSFFLDLKSVHEKDRHVAACALSLAHKAHVPVALVTWNVKDFPRRNLNKLNILRYTPDELCLSVWSERGALFEGVRESTRQMLQYFKSYPLAAPTEFQSKARPLPETENEWLEFFARNRMHGVKRRLS